MKLFDRSALFSFGWHQFHFPLLIAVIFCTLTALTVQAERLSASQVAQHAYNAGFRNEGLVMAVAIAKAESGYVTDIYNENKRNGVTVSTDWGLWQINDYWHPDVSHGIDPACAAEAAYRISDGGADWSPWVTFNTGAHEPFLEEARNAAYQAGGESQVATGGSTLATRHLQAQIDIDRFVGSDAQFGSLTSNLAMHNNWDSNWELRYQSYRFNIFGKAVVFHATNIADPSIRYVIFWNSFSNGFNGWSRI